MDAREKKHHTPVKDISLSKEKYLEQRRARSELLRNERRDAVLRSKRLRRVFEQDEPVDKQISMLNSDALVLATINGVQEAKNSQKEGGQKHLSNIRYVRKLLTESSDPPLQTFLDGGVVPLLADSVQSLVPNADVRETMVEAVWALAYLAGGAHHVAEAVLPLAGSLILHLSGHLGWHVAEVCAWALGNLSADCHQFADTIVANGAVVPLSNLVFNSSRGIAGMADPEIVVVGVTAAWALSNAIRNSKAAGIQLMSMESAPEKLCEMLTIHHVNLVSEVLWMIVYLVATSLEHLEQMVRVGLCPSLVKLLVDAVQQLEEDISSGMMVLIPALRALGNVISGAQTESVTEIVQCEGGSLLSSLVACLSCTHRGIQKEVAWVLSNIAGCPDRTEAQAIRASGAVPILLDLACNAAFDIRKESTFVLANLTMGDDNEPDVGFLQQLLQSSKLIGSIIQFMRSPDMEAVRLAVQFTEMVLRVVPNGPQMIEEADGIDALEVVQYGNVPPELQKMAADLVDTYYGESYGE